MEISPRSLSLAILSEGEAMGVFGMLPFCLGAVSLIGPPQPHPFSIRFLSTSLLMTSITDVPAHFVLNLYILYRMVDFIEIFY